MTKLVEQSEAQRLRQNLPDQFPKGRDAFAWALAERIYQDCKDANDLPPDLTVEMIYDEL